MKITIECDKDIESLNITFADGSTSKSEINYKTTEPKQVSSSPQSSKTQKNKKPEAELDFDDFLNPKENSNPSDKVEKPIIDISNREAKVVSSISEESF